MKLTTFSLRLSTLLIAAGRKKILGTAILSTALMGCSSTQYDLPGAPHEEGILLRSVHILPGQPGRTIPPALRAPGLAELGIAQTGHFLIHFRGEASSLRLALEGMGIRIDTYLPHNGFLITLNGQQGVQLEVRRTALGIDHLEPYHPLYKVAPEVARLTQGSEDIGLILHLFLDADLTQLRTQLEALGLQIDGTGGQHFKRVGLRISKTRLVELRNRLTVLPDLFWIELRGKVRLHNDQAVPILESGAIPGETVLSAHGLHGEGQIVGYIDTGNDYDSCYFRDESGRPPMVNVNGGTAVDMTHRKIIAYDMLWSEDDPADATEYDNHGHGSHVGGNIGGDNLANPIERDSMDGMATAAKFVVQDGGYRFDLCSELPALGCPVVDLQPFFQQAYTQGARVHTNSWGDNEEADVQNNYSAGCEDVDAFMHSHPDFLLLFAAGNEGPEDATVGSPSTAKNVLSIGGTGNGQGAEAVASFSSRGPTADNRLKPDLLAPATNTAADTDYNVETDNCNLSTGGGTSYAAPLAAGAAALVRQYFMDGYYPSGVPSSGAHITPSSALVKATLINSGVNVKLEEPLPSYGQGWGRIGLDSTLPFPGDLERLKVEDNPTTFQAGTDAPYSLKVQVMNSSIPLKVTLVWTDPPATPAAAISLVNDLNLTVSDGRRTYLGNVFRLGRSVAGGIADERNNVEQVLLSVPRAGTYTITVTPRSIPEGPQGFSLVVRGSLP